MRWRLTYWFVHRVGCRLYGGPDGTVDWDEISLGDFLDNLHRRAR